MRQGCCKECLHVFIMVGGDQGAESLAKSVTKSQTSAARLESQCESSHRASTCFGCTWSEEKPGTQLCVVGISLLQNALPQLPTHLSARCFQMPPGNEKSKLQTEHQTQGRRHETQQIQHINIRPNASFYKVTQTQRQNSVFQFDWLFSMDLALILACTWIPNMWKQNTRKTECIVPNIADTE